MIKTYIDHFNSKPNEKINLLLNYEELECKFSKDEVFCSDCKGQICDGCLNYKNENIFEKMATSVEKYRIDELYDNIGNIISYQHYFTLTGSLSNTFFSKLLEILISNIEEINQVKMKYDISEENLIEYKKNLISSYLSKSGFTSVVGSHKNNSLKEKLNIRNSQQIDFGPNVVSLVSDFIIPQIKKNIDYNYVDIVMEPSHGNIVYYPSGGKFELHRDKLLEPPFHEDELKNRKSIMYTLIVSLDSNLNNRFESNDGNTIVYLPLKHFYDINNEEDEIYNRITVPHIFNQSCVPGNWLLFPSQAKHGSIQINSQDKYKCILKMDLFILYDNDEQYYNIKKSKYHASKLTDYIESCMRIRSYQEILTNDEYCKSIFIKEQNRFMSSLLCNCKLCDKSQKMYITYSLLISKYNIPSSVNLIIMDFLMEPNHRVRCINPLTEDRILKGKSQDINLCKCVRCDEFRMLTFRSYQKDSARYEVFRKDISEFEKSNRLAAYVNYEIYNDKDSYCND